MWLGVGPSAYIYLLCLKLIVFCKDHTMYRLPGKGKKNYDPLVLTDYFDVI